MLFRIKKNGHYYIQKKFLFLWIDITEIRLTIVGRLDVPKTFLILDDAINYIIRKNSKKYNHHWIDNFINDTRDDIQYEKTKKNVIIKFHKCKILIDHNELVRK